MSPGHQLRLFPAAQPLVDRLGVAFFRAIPSAPGVYRMFDGAGVLIYVGKAKDLRARLGSYRRTHGHSRKTVRLIHEVRRIEWEVCADEAEARRRESEWIRTVRPRFNRAGVWPRSARFVRVEGTAGGFRVEVVSESGGAGEVFGAFRGGAAEAVGALARLIWWARRGCSGVGALPRGLVAGERVRRFECEGEGAAEWREGVCRFLGSADDGLVARLTERVPEPGTAFDRAYVARQFEVVLEFHRRGPVRNLRLQAVLGGERPWMEPEEQADALAWLGPEVTPPEWRWLRGNGSGGEGSGQAHER